MLQHQWPRRQWLQRTSSALALSTWATTARGASVRSAPPHEILELKVISWKEPLYHGWPTLARRRNGELLLAFSGGRESHVCPFGRVEWMRSKDQGKTWSWPRVLYDGPIDDRDAGVVETAKGTILVTTFTSVAYEPTLQRASKTPVGQSGGFVSQLLLDQWQAVHGRLSDAERKGELGSYMLRSTDGGTTWSARYRVPINSPHGPFVTSQGRLLYAGKELFTTGRIGLWESQDDGLSWQELGEIPTRDGDDFAKYHELHAVEAADGTLLCHIRNENVTNGNETLQCESQDGGRTWSVPHTIGVWGLPSHLLRLTDGRLLMSYGHRRAPLGNQARLSDDHGRTWSEPILISGDANSGDLGYPSTVQCDDGTLVTVWYELLRGSPNAQLRQATWRLL